MMSDALCIHALNGRLRIKSASVRGSREKAWEVQGHLQSIAGVTQATANPTTGSVLVLYDPHRITQMELLNTFRTLSCFSERRNIQTPTQDIALTQKGFSQDLLRSLVLSTIELAVQHLVRTLS
jgi:hypothetical protein